MAPRLQERRAVAWLCLCVALLISVMPASGLIVCLGHDGHLAVGHLAAGQLAQGAREEAGRCPCQHDHGTGRRAAELPSAELPSQGEPHPPCEDIAIDPPDYSRDGDPARLTRGSAAGGGGDDGPGPGALPPSCEAPRPAAAVRSRLPAAQNGRQRPPPHLEALRTVVLLI